MSIGLGPRALDRVGKLPERRITDIWSNTIRASLRKTLQIEKTEGARVKAGDW